jgi:hypothetical protein
LRRGRGRADSLPPCYHFHIMTFGLRAFKLNEVGPTGDSYALTVENKDPKDSGLSKTAIWQHSFPTIVAVTEFLVTNCKPEELQIAELKRQLLKGQDYVTKVSRESAVRMGFK